ncbi:MAG: GNAT family N-acetyltransferase, partial [Eubacteriales bacterium]|nr:GNAT family N-acetyltransferase [Eubacteriales bacterium]
PEWFGIEESTKEYIETSKMLKFFACFLNDIPIGFISIIKHYDFSAEIYIIGVLKEYHNNGIGKLLIKTCENYCIENNILFLQVKTIAETNKDKNYAITRNFYKKVGFVPLELIPNLWDKNNPCLIMIKYIAKKDVS